LFSESPKLSLPAEDAVIWHYYTFTEFIAMLVERALFFCRVDKLKDQWEGVYPKGMLDWWAENLGESSSFQGKPWDLKDFLIAKVIPSHFINSWYISEHESDAMWRIYSENSEGIAVKSTLGRLKRTFRNTPEEILIGEVKYIDYNQWHPPAELEKEGLFSIEPFFWKRLGFQHENELRAVIKRDWVDQKENGINLKIDLRELIDSIYLFPDSKDWFFRLVRTLIDKFGYADLELKRSTLGERPWK
jgi:hypothetical protein